MAKLTTEAFVAEAKKKHGEYYDYSRAIYDGAHTLLTIVCPTHGAFQQRAADHTNGKGCKLCGVSKSSPPALTAAEFIARSQKVHSDFYDYTETAYTAYKEAVTIECPTHGKFTQIAGAHVRGSGCPLCRKGNTQRVYRAKTREERQEEWKEKSASKHGNYYDYSKVEFVNSKLAVEIGCPDHGPFRQSPGNHLHGGCRCPECAQLAKADKVTKTQADWLAGFVKTHAGAYSYTDAAITSSNQRIDIGCKTHGMFNQQAYVHAAGHGCPKCAGSVSGPETELREWIESLMPGEVVRGDRNIIAPYELDVFLPAHNVAVEFNGTYWHSDARKEKLYHQRKSLMCKEKGILLIHIYEHDWAIKRGACERLILGKIGKADRTLDARKLRVGPAEDCAAFVSSYHFQGNVASEVQYGLFLGETMVAAMTFGKTRYNKNYKWELLRLCTITGTRVRGGASRLFAKFKQEHLQSGDTVISYARLDYSVGGVYAALGFSFDGVCAPDYRWIKQPNVSLSRHATQKHRLSRLLGDKFDASKSETQNMKDSGYKRVYSAGNLRYVYSHE